MTAIWYRQKRRPFVIDYFASSFKKAVGQKKDNSHDILTHLFKFTYGKPRETAQQCIR